MAEEKQQTNQGGGAAAGGATGGGVGAQSNIDSGKPNVRQAADDLRSAATGIAQEYRGRAEQAWGDATDRARTFQEDGEQYVRENPTKAVFSALGIGFILGMIFRK